MPAADSPAILCARYLKANNYNETPEAFLSEAGLPSDAGSVNNPGDLTIEKVLEEKKVFDLSLTFERFNLAETARRGRSGGCGNPAQCQYFCPPDAVFHPSGELATGRIKGMGDR
ncbi:hypothetical protein XANCAGTX0491_001697 [Xanthoria calcicola]